MYKLVMSLPVLNVNVGLLGHVDSGKTSIARALSTVASTASFDHSPQSMERGITLDLGFSSFTLPSPDASKYSSMQVTLVDCPGHASLIRTILGGAQIIDMMVLVIDAAKGIQTQTAECIVISEVLSKPVMVVVNKIDDLPGDYKVSLEKVIRKLKKTFEKTKLHDPPIVAVSADVKKVDKFEENELSDVIVKGKKDAQAYNISNLLEEMKRTVGIPERLNVNSPLLFMADHCFGIRGQGTVLTGTVLSGNMSISDDVEIPRIKIRRKIKSIQMFHKPVEHVQEGDRCAVAVSQMDPKQFERGYLCTLGYLTSFVTVIARVSKIRFHKRPALSGQRFHSNIFNSFVSIPH